LRIAPRNESHRKPCVPGGRAGQIRDLQQEKARYHADGLSIATLACYNVANKGIDWTGETCLSATRFHWLIHKR